MNPLVEVYAITERLTKSNAKSIMADCSIVVDALDNIESRFILQETAEELGIPLVHGAIAGWYGQVTTIFPGDRTLNLIYANSDNQGLEKQLGNPPFTSRLDSFNSG